MYFDVCTERSIPSLPGNNINLIFITGARKMEVAEVAIYVVL